MNISKSRITDTHKFIALSAFIFILIFTFENINHRFFLNDFKVYYLAAKALVNGQQVYGISFGLSSGFYKYSPATLLFFTPYVLFPFEVARIIHYFFICTALISLIILLKQLFEKYTFLKENKRSYLLLFSIFLCALNHIFREVHLGNINVILLWMMCLALKYTLESKNKSAGFLISFVFLCKPYFLLLLLPLLIHRKIKVLIYAAVTTVLLLLVPAVFMGFSNDISFHQDWIKAMLAHDGYLYSYHTIFSLVKTYVYSAAPSVVNYFIIAVVLGTYAWYCWILHQTDRANNDLSLAKNQSLLVEYLIIIAIIPNLITTDTEHFLLSIPLIALLISFLSGSKNYLLIGCFILLIVAYEGNSTDWFGNDLSNQFEQKGILGISNLIIIISGAYTFYRYKIQHSGRSL